MGLFSKKCWFDYVGEMSESMLKTVTLNIERYAESFEIRDFVNGEAIIKKIYQVVEQVLQSNTLPQGYENTQQLAEGLGVLYGHALCVGRKWKWRRLGDDARNATICVVSPKENFSLEPVKYILHILDSETSYTYSNTVINLYDKLEKIDRKPRKQKYYPVV